MTRRGHLFMKRSDLEAVPAPAPPAGFRLRCFHPGDEAAWLEIIRRAYGRHWPHDAFHRCVETDESFRPQRLFFVEEDAAPARLVGTAGAFQKIFHGDRTGYVHMLAVLPEVQGRGLGAALLRQCLLQFRVEGWRDAVLDTEAARPNAVRLYLAHGFLPFPEVREDLAVWREVLERLGREDLIPGLQLPRAG